MKIKLRRRVVPLLCISIATATTFSCASIRTDGQSERNSGAGPGGQSAAGAIPFVLREADIPNEFDLKNINIGNIASYVVECIGLNSSETATVKAKANYAAHLRKLAFGEINVVAERNENFNQEFVYSGRSGVCIELSSNNFPIFPVRAFEKTINPQGVQANKLRSWFRTISLTIARKGSATVAYKFSNGSAFLANYRARKTAQIYYSTDFRMPDEWQEENVDHVFSDSSMHGLRATDYNGLMRKIPVWDGFERRLPPVRQYSAGL